MKKIFVRKLITWTYRIYVIRQWNQYMYVDNRKLILTHERRWTEEDYKYLNKIYRRNGGIIVWDGMRLGEIHIYTTA